MSVQEVAVRAAPVDWFAPVIGAPRVAALRRDLEAERRALNGRRLWHVNSTAAGGGVAEMLHVLLGYERNAGVDVRWAVVGGDAAFFALTKRLHNRLHGHPGDGLALDAAAHAHYRRISAANAAALRPMLRADDVVVLHDPQTAGLAAALADLGVHVVWRCHIGGDDPGDALVQEGWDFLRRYLGPVEALVFSRAAHIPAWAEGVPTWVVPPCIDPFSPKNTFLEPAAVETVLARTGVITADPDGPPLRFRRADGRRDQVGRPAEVVRAGPPPAADVPLVVQVSRWDRLKDMTGLLRAFAGHAADLGDAHLALVGPSVAGVSDDPEGRAVLEECVALWHGLSPAIRRRVQLVSLPMDDLVENAAMVNALQRHATVLVQKSLAEGFGLTVTEGMWKSRPVIASRVGGIQDQITHGESGVLVDDPRDLDAVAGAMADVLAGPVAARRIGDCAHARVIDAYLGDRHLTQMARLVTTLLEAETPVADVAVAPAAR
jgi:trehalose synthase